MGIFKEKSGQGPLIEWEKFYELPTRKDDTHQRRSAAF